MIFTTTSLHHTTLVLICIRFTCPRCYSEGQEDRLVRGGQRQTTVRKLHTSLEEAHHTHTHTPPSSSTPRNDQPTPVSTSDMQVKLTYQSWSILGPVC